MRNYAVLEIIRIDGLSVPVLDIPMMKDRRRRHYISDEVLERARWIQMTDRQRSVWDLYGMGVPLKAIAGKLGISTGCVDGAVAQVLWKLSGKPCRYSDDCFCCPMPDCVLSPRQASFANLLPPDKNLSLWRK